MGNVIFISYRASMFSALSVRREVLPFRNFQQLLDSKYRFAKCCKTKISDCDKFHCIRVVMKSGDLHASQFNKSDLRTEDTFYSKIKMDKRVDMYLTYKECFDEMLKDPLGTTFLGALESLLRFKEFR